MSDVPGPKNRQPLRLQFWLYLCVVFFGTRCADVSVLYFYLMAAKPLFGVNSSLQMQCISDWTHSFDSFLCHASLIISKLLSILASLSVPFPTPADRTPNCLPVLRISAYWFSGFQSALNPQSKFSEACLQAVCPCYRPLFLWKLYLIDFASSVSYYLLCVGIVLEAGIATVNKTPGGSQPKETWRR